MLQLRGLTDRQDPAEYRQLGLPLLYVAEQKQLTLNDCVFDAETTPTYTILFPYIGRRYAWLLYRLGYKNLADLANETEYAMSCNAGLGRKRLARIGIALADYGLSFKEMDTSDASHFQAISSLDEDATRRALRQSLTLYSRSQDPEPSTSGCPGRSASSRPGTPHLHLVKSQDKPYG